jgi:hypothetical protein
VLKFTMHARSSVTPADHRVRDERLARALDPLQQRLVQLVQVGSGGLPVTDARAQVSGT